MPTSPLKSILFNKITHSSDMSTSEMQEFLEEKVSQRTIKRWVNQWIIDDKIEQLGKNKFARYRLKAPTSTNKLLHLGFLQTIPDHKRMPVLAELRDLWTHNSTSIEGNTLTLGETYDILEYGLTISGKPLKEHQEIIGHAKAISLLYDVILNNTPLNKTFICQLHQAVQTENYSRHIQTNGRLETRKKRLSGNGLPKHPKARLYRIRPSRTYIGINERIHQNT